MKKVVKKIFSLSSSKKPEKRNQLFENRMDFNSETQSSNSLSSINQSDAGKSRKNESGKFSVSPVRIYLSLIHFLLKKSVWIIVLTLALFTFMYYLNFNSFMRQYSIPFSPDSNLFITTRSCKIEISDSFHFSEIKTRVSTILTFASGYHHENQTNHIWFETSKEHTECLIQVPLVKPLMSLHISCLEDCIIRVFNTHSTIIEDLFIFSYSMHLKMKNLFVKQLVASAKTIVFLGRDFYSERTFLSADYIFSRLTFLALRPSIHFGYIPNTFRCDTNIKTIHYNQTTVGTFILDYSNSTSAGFDLSTPALLKISVDKFNQIPIENLLFALKGSTESSGSNSMVFLARDIFTRIKEFNLAEIDEEQYISNLVFSLNYTDELSLANAALKVNTYKYFVIVLTNLSFGDQNLFKIIVFNGSLIPFTAENFLQITSAKKYSKVEPVDIISLIIASSQDSNILESLSLRTQIEYFRELKNFFIEKVVNLTNTADWKVIIADPYFSDKNNNELYDFFNSDLLDWINLNTVILLVCVIVNSIIFAHSKSKVVRLIQKEAAKIKQNEFFLKQVVNEGFMFVNLAEITEFSYPHPDVLEILSFPTNYILLSKILRQFLNIEVQISESDFLKYVTDYQPPTPDNRIEFSKIFEAYHNFLSTQRVSSFSNNQEELQEALISQGLILESNPNDPEFQILGLKIVGFQRGNLFKDKLFLSMDPNFNSLEYFIANHCKNTKKDSDLISLSEFGSAYSIFCKSTSSSKRAFDENNLKELYGFTIKRSPKLFVIQGPRIWRKKFISLKIDLIEAIAKDLPDSTSNTNTLRMSLNSQVNYNRLLLFFTGINIFEIWSLNWMISFFYNLRFMFDHKIIPYSLALLNDEYNSLTSFDVNTILSHIMIIMLFTPLHPSGFAIICGNLYNISFSKSEILRKFFIFFVILTLVILIVGLICLISFQIFEFFMLFMSVKIGMNQHIDFIYIVFKILFSVFVFFSSNSSVRSAKIKLKGLIDLHFSELLSELLRAKLAKTQLKSEKLRDERERATEIIRGWIEDKKTSMNQFLIDAQPSCLVIANSYQRTMNEDEISNFLSETLGVKNDTPLVQMLIIFYQLKNEQKKAPEFLKQLKKAFHLFTFIVCKEDEEAARFFYTFVNLYLACQIEDKNLILKSSIDFLKTIVDKDSHFVIDSLTPSFVDICTSDYYSEFKDENMFRLKKILDKFSLELNSEVSEILNYLPIEYDKSNEKVKKSVLIPRLELGSLWRPIQAIFSLQTQKELTESSRYLDSLFKEMLPENLSYRNWNQLTFSYSKYSNIDENLLKFFCEVLLTNNDKEVNYTLSSIKQNPYFKIIKRKFSVSAINLSGAVNINRRNFKSESSAMFILSLFKKTDNKSIPIQFYFIHLLFNRTQHLSKFVSLLEVIEPRLYRFCLTSKVVILTRAYDFYSKSNKKTKNFLAQITKGTPIKSLSSELIESMDKYAVYEDHNLSEFVDVFKVFLKIRNFDFDIKIKKLVSITPLLKNLSDEETTQLDQVIQGIVSIISKSAHPYIPEGVIEAVKLFSTLQRIDQISSSDLETNFGFLITERMNWKIVSKYVRKFYIWQIKNRNSSFSSLPNTIVEYFTDEVNSPKLFRQILMQLKLFLSLDEQKELANIEFDETSFGKTGRTSLGTLMPFEINVNSFKDRVRNLMFNFIFRGEEKMAAVLYIFFHLKGFVKRQLVSFSYYFEELIGKEFGIDPFIFRALGQVICPQPSQNSNDFFLPLREFLLSHPQISGNFQMKEITNSIFNPELITTINRIIKGQINFEQFFENEVKDKKLSTALRFLLELKLKKNSQSQNFGQNLDYTLEKYSFSVKEVVDIYNLCKRRDIDLVEAFSEGVKKDTLELVRSFLLAQSKLKLPDSEQQKRFLQNNSLLFRVLGLKEDICWTILLIKRGNFKLMRRFLRSEFREQAHHGYFLLDILEETLNFTRRACRMIRKGKNQANFSSPILQVNPWVEKLMNLHKHPDAFRACSQEIKGSLTLFSYVVLLTLKYSDPNMLEFLFDLQFFNFFSRLIKKFKNDFKFLRSVAKSIELIELDRKDLSNIFIELIKIKRLFISYSKLISLITPSEKELLDSLIGETSDPNVAFNTMINQHLFTGWRRRVKDETMLKEINLFSNKTFSKPLHYYMFDSADTEIENLLENRTYFSSFSKFLIDVFTQTVLELSKLSSQNSSSFFEDQFNFGSSLFISTLFFKISELSISQKSNFFTHYPIVFYKADLLFRFLEKSLVIYPLNKFFRKECLIKQYLFYFGIMLKPQHSLVFSPSIQSPASLVYLFYLIRKSRNKNKDFEIDHDFMDYYLKLPVHAQIEMKIKVISRFIETDRLKSKSGQPLQVFRRFSIDPVAQVNEKGTFFEYTIKLRDGSFLDLSLYKYNIEIDLSLLESFYFLHVLVKDRPERSFYRIFEKLNPMMCTKELYYFEILNSPCLRPKFKVNTEEIFKLVFGLFFSKLKKIQTYNLNYYRISLSYKVFDVLIDDVFEYRETSINFHLLDLGTKAVLDIVRSLQNQVKSWDSNTFLASLKDSKMKLKSDLTVLGVIFEYLLSPGLLRKFKRLLQHLQLLQHQQQLGEHLDHLRGPEFFPKQKILVR